MDRYELVPIGENAGTALDRVLEAYGKSGVGLKECLDDDSSALSGQDMKYFGEEYFGRVPSYATFIKYLNKLPVDQKDNFWETVSEIESGRCVGEMKEVADGGSYERDDQVRFNMYGKLNGIYERKLDRIDRRRRDRGISEEKSVDLAARLISALSNKDLLRIKGQAEAIDAEYKEVADGPIKGGENE